MSESPNLVHFAKFALAIWLLKKWFDIKFKCFCFVLFFFFPHVKGTLDFDRDCVSQVADSSSGLFAGFVSETGSPYVALTGLGLTR